MNISSGRKDERERVSFLRRDCLVCSEFESKPSDGPS